VAYHGFKPAEQAIQIGDDEILSSHISDGVIVNADVNASAAIATSKVSGAVTSIGSHGLGSLATLSAVASAQITDGTIVNADVNNSAAIATSKLSGSLTSVTSHGLATSATTDTTNASNISSGTLAAARVATLNQNTTGQAGTVATITGLAPDTATTQATQASITSAANLATVGTITSGVWNSSTKIASAYLDDDTAHLSTTQTFSGAKTFSADMALTTGSNPTFTVTEGSVAGGMRTKGAGLFVGTTSEHSLYLTTGGLADADKALTIDTSQNATFAGNVTLTKSGDPVLALTGTGANSNTYIDNNITGGGDAYFRYNGATGDLRFINNVSNETAIFTLNGAGNATFAGDVNVAQRIQHTGDTNTQISLETSQMTLAAGGPYISLNNDDKVYIGTGSGGTTALTLDTSQNATFAGNVEVKTLTSEAGDLDGDQQVVSAAGTISPSALVVQVIGGGAARTTSDSEAISAGTVGQLLILVHQDGAYPVTLKDNANTELAGDFTMTGSTTMMLVFGNSVWREVSRSSNG